MKQSVTLLFPSYVHLWDFIVCIQLSSFELSPGCLALYCECTGEQINQAVSSFGATLNEEMKCEPSVINNE